MKSYGLIVVLGILYFNLNSQIILRKSNFYIAKSSECLTYSNKPISHLKITKRKITLYDLDNNILLKTKYETVKNNDSLEHSDTKFKNLWKSKLKMDDLTFYLTNMDTSKNLKFLDTKNSGISYGAVNIAEFSYEISFSKRVKIPKRIIKNQTSLIPLNNSKAIKIVLNKNDGYTHRIRKIGKSYYLTTTNNEKQNNFVRFEIVSFEKNNISVKYSEETEVKYVIDRNKGHR